MAVQNPPIKQERLTEEVARLFPRQGEWTEADYEEQLAGPPNLAVEILSPATRKTDRQEKFQEYAQAGISEYWILDPKARTVEVFFLEHDVYSLVGKFERGSNARSRLFESFEIPVNQVFAR